MVRQVSKFICGLSVLSAVGLSSLAFAPTASAFTFSDTWDKVDITDADIGKSFKVTYEGSVEGKLVTGLSALTKYTFRGFSYADGDTFAEFDILVQNTSTGIQSRVSAIGFNTSLTEKSGTTLTGLNPSTPVYSNVQIGKSFPNEFGSVDVCFINAPNNCNGGSSGGVTNYTPSGNNGGVEGQANFKAKLRFEQPNANTIALSNFGVRFQSIDGTVNGTKYIGASGTGKGWIKKPRDPNKVPEPMTGAALLAVGAMVAMKKRQQTSQNA